MRKLEPIARLNIRRPNMVKQGLVYSKQNRKWMLKRYHRQNSVITVGDISHFFLQIYIVKSSDFHLDMLPSLTTFSSLC